MERARCSARPQVGREWAMLCRRRVREQSRPGEDVREGEVCRVSSTMVERPLVHVYIRRAAVSSGSGSGPREHSARAKTQRRRGAGQPLTCAWLRAASLQRCVSGTALLLLRRLPSAPFFASAIGASPAGPSSSPPPPPGAVAVPRQTMQQPPATPQHEPRVPGILTSEHVELGVPVVSNDGRPPAVKYTYAVPPRLPAAGRPPAAGCWRWRWLRGFPAVTHSPLMPAAGRCPPITRRCDTTSALPRPRAGSRCARARRAIGRVRAC
jgi:hypothetical protein